MSAHKFRSWAVGFTLLFSMFLSVSSRADAAGAVSFQITQVKITTGAQFVTIQNTGVADVDSSGLLQLVYYNNYDRSKATSSKLLALSGIMPPKGFYLFNDGPLSLCYQAIVDSASLGFSTTSGTLELVRLDTSAVLSSVKWASKSNPAGVQLLPTQVDGSNNFLQYDQANQKWMAVSATNAKPCDLQTVVAGADSGGSALPSGSAPSVSVITQSDISKQKNAGLKNPVLNELLPNPASPDTDTDDEYIEIYNPNSKAFSLEGYSLQTGLTTKHTYNFEADDELPPKSFTSFYSAATSISLSNSGSKVILLDPDAETISQSATYGTAKDGQVWALANGKWVWMITPSPGKANDGVSAEPVEAKTSDPTAAGTQDSTATANTGANVSSATANKTVNTLDDAAPLHPLVLAGVGLGAVAYALYEYRKDMANRIFQFKRYLRTRRAVR